MKIFLVLLVTFSISVALFEGIELAKLEVEQDVYFDIMTRFMELKHIMHHFHGRTPATSTGDGVVGMITMVDNFTGKPSATGSI